MIDPLVLSLSVLFNSAPPKCEGLQVTAKGVPVWPLRPRTLVHHLEVKTKTNTISQCHSAGTTGASDVCPNTRAKVPGKSHSRGHEGAPVRESNLPGQEICLNAITFFLSCTNMNMCPRPLFRLPTHGSSCSVVETCWNLSDFTLCHVDSNILLSICTRYPRITNPEFQGCADVLNVLEPFTSLLELL